MPPRLFDYPQSVLCVITTDSNHAARLWLVTFERTDKLVRVVDAPAGFKDRVQGTQWPIGRAWDSFCRRHCVARTPEDAWSRYYARKDRLAAILRK